MQSGPAPNPVARRKWPLAAEQERVLKSFYEGRLTAGQLMGALCEATELAARAGETRAEPAQRRAA